MFASIESTTDLVEGQYEEFYDEDKIISLKHPRIEKKKVSGNSERKVPTS